MTPPPIPIIRFTDHYGVTAVVQFELDTYRTYIAAEPRGGGSETMVVARYADALGAYPEPFCTVYAERSVGIAAILAALARSAVAHYRTWVGGMPQYVGISWPLSQRAIYHLAHGDYAGYRFRGSAGCVRGILPADYGSIAFWVEPNGVPPVAPPPV